MNLRSFSSLIHAGWTEERFHDWKTIVHPVTSFLGMIYRWATEQAEGLTLQSLQVSSRQILQTSDELGAVQVMLAWITEVLAS